MKQFNCIVCPRGCLLKVEQSPEGYVVSGNGCRRGQDFALTEMTAPMRTVCSVVKTAYPGVPVLPVRVSGEIPKERIFDVIREIHRVKLSKPVGRGEVIIADVLTLGVDVISTSDALMNVSAHAAEEKK